MKHDLFHSYPVLADKPGELVAHFKYTVLILKGSTIAITGLPLDISKFKTDKKIEDESLIQLINVGLYFLNIMFMIIYYRHRWIKKVKRRRRRKKSRFKVK